VNDENTLSAATFLRTIMCQPAHWLLTFALLLGLVGHAMAQEYKIGPQDVLTIRVWGQDDLSKDYVVDPDGFVPFPLVGRVNAAGITTKAFASRLRELLEKDYLVDPQVSVSVKEYLSKKVYVLGEAEKRGVFYLKGPTSLLELLSHAGGLSKSAGKQVMLMRNRPPSPADSPGENTVLRLNLDKIQAGDASENVQLEDEDTVVLLRGNMFFVFGEVKKPGAYQLDKDTNVLEGITIAGGLTDKAAPGRIRVIRTTGKGEQKTINVDINEIIKRGQRDKAIGLLEDDVVVVPESFF
jgi:polysaccharide export outer membrane protein